MSGSSYRNLLQLMKSWPVDPTKAGGRDLGEYIRQRVSLTYRLGEATPVDEQHCGAVWASLHRLAQDTHRERYPRIRSSSALGLSKEECSGILSNETLKLLKEREEPFLGRVIGWAGKGRKKSEN